MAKQDADDALLRFRKLARPVRLVYARPRTFVSIAIGIVAYLLLPSSLLLLRLLLHLSLSQRLRLLRRFPH